MTCAYALHGVLFESYVKGKIRIAERRIARAKKKLAKARRERSAVSKLRMETYEEFCKKANRIMSEPRVVVDASTHIFEMPCNTNPRIEDTDV